jgi:DNA-directed RNA polymerase specialized sigma24 family protein
MEIPADAHQTAGETTKPTKVTSVALARAPGHGAMNSRKFFAELKRRKVYKVAIAFAVVAWLLMQIASQIFPFFEIPNWAVRLVVLLLVIGFPVALILAWAFDLTPEGIKRAEDHSASKPIAPKTGNVSAIVLAGAGQKASVPFTNTHWSMVLDAQSELRAAREALKELFRIYWRPVYNFVQRQGIGPKDAEDLTQGFIALLLERKDLNTIRKEKGRLRPYLLASVKNFLADERRRAMAIERGKGERLIPFEEIRERGRIAVERRDRLTADQIYEHRWALTVLERVMTRLRDEYRSVGNPRFFDQMKKMLMEEPGRPPRARVASEFDMTENAVKQAFFRFRQSYQALLREEISRTVAMPSDIEDELRHLIGVVRA